MGQRLRAHASTEIDSSPPFIEFSFPALRLSIGISSSGRNTCVQICVCGSFKFCRLHDRDESSMQASDAVGLLLTFDEDWLQTVCDSAEKFRVLRRRGRPAGLGLSEKPMLFVTRRRARCPFVCRFRLFVSIARRVHRETTRDCLIVLFASAVIGLSDASGPQKRGHRLVGSRLEMMMAPVVKAFVHAVCSVDWERPCSRTTLLKFSCYGDSLHRQPRTHVRKTIVFVAEISSSHKLCAVKLLSRGKGRKQGVQE